MSDAVLELELVAERLRDHAEIESAYVFGSRATGRPRPGSDLDIALIFVEGTPDMRRFTLRCELSSSVAVAAALSSADVVDLERAPPLLAHEILKGGRLLFSRDDGRRIQIVARQNMRYIDTARMRRTLDEATFRRLREGTFGRLA